MNNGETVDIWLQRMTYQGGWERMHEDFTPDEFRSRPTSDDDFRITLPGRYRAVTRDDGRLAEVLWEYETDDAEGYYNNQRREVRQRERLYEMSIAELDAELRRESNELDMLSYSEVKDRFEELGGWDALDNTS